jgi:hypothetical protein
MLKDLKDKYNTLLKRHNKGALYLDDISMPAAEREKWIPEFIKIVTGLESTLSEIQISGEVTEDEILNGFK